MSLYLSVALPRLALVASDTRVVNIRGARIGEHHRDGYRKLGGTPSGWLVGGALIHVTDFLGPILGACPSLDDIERMLNETKADANEIVLKYAPPDIQDPRQAQLFFVEPGELAVLNFRTAEVERLGCTAALQGPYGTEPEDFDDLFATYGQPLMRIVTAFPDRADADLMRDLVRLTADFFAGSYEMLGADGNMGPMFEMGFVRQTPTGREHWHLPPCPSDAPEPETLHRVEPQDVRFGWMPAAVKAT